MGFESQGESSFMGKSPGGFEFGIQGFSWGQPKPTSITFFLDNTAMVCDQYGRKICRAVIGDKEVRFADSPPDASRDGSIVPRPQFATHVQVIEALAAEKINWLAYQVQYVDRAGQSKARSNLTPEEASKMQEKLLSEGNRNVVIIREIVSAGWPQLPYDRPKEGPQFCLKDLPELPPTPIEELRKITNASLRKDALRIRREADGARDKELQAAETE